VVIRPAGYQPQSGEPELPGQCQRVVQHRFLVFRKLRSHSFFESYSFGGDDIGWIFKAGGYFSKRAAVPPQDRLNAGQKLFYLIILLLGTAIAVSGFIIWFRPAGVDIRKWVLLSHLVHNIGFVLMVTIIPLHIYLATLANPGTFRIMVYGTVPVEWAKKRHAKWVQKMGF